MREGKTQRDTPVMNLRSDFIRAALRSSSTEVERRELELESGSVDARSSCDIGYVLFLEEAEEADPGWSTVEWLADKLIRTFSPAPSSIVHCELIIPPIPNSDMGRVHFATYLGSEGADWQSRGPLRASGVHWYLVENGARWRALPVFGTDCANALRQAAERNVDAQYSVLMYATSARPLRGLAWLWGDPAGHKGHCATVTSRILKEASVDTTLTQPSAWYAPSSLFSALLRSMSTRQAVDPDVYSSLTTTDSEACDDAVSTLLHAPLSYQSVRELGDERCIDAMRELTRRVVVSSESGNVKDGRAQQKELATALLRWVLLRSDPSCPD